MFRDKQGNHIRYHEVIALQANVNYPLVETTILEEAGVQVKTFWLGCESQAEEYFETRILCSEFSEILARYRYTTIEEAKRGHKAIVGAWLSQPELMNHMTFYP